jgi:hypothetical protein
MPGKKPYNMAHSPEMMKPYEMGHSPEMMKPYEMGHSPKEMKHSSAILKHMSS